MRPQLEDEVGKFEKIARGVGDMMPIELDGQRTFK